MVPAATGGGGTVVGGSVGVGVVVDSAVLGVDMTTGRLRSTRGVP